MTEERKSSRWPLFRLAIPLPRYLGRVPNLPPAWRPWFKRKWPYIAGLAVLSILLMFLIALEQSRAPELGLDTRAPGTGRPEVPANEPLRGAKGGVGTGSGEPGTPGEVRGGTAVPVKPGTEAGREATRPGTGAPVTDNEIAVTEEPPFPPESAFAPASPGKSGQASSPSAGRVASPQQEPAGSRPEGSASRRPEGSAGSGPEGSASPGREGSGRSGLEITGGNRPERSTAASEPPAGTPTETMLKPVNGKVISPYGWVQSRTLSSETSTEYRLHTGVDMAAAEGTPVKAAFSGEVTFAGQTDEIGLAVVVNHGAGKETLYGNLSQITIKRGSRVARGDTIGKVGNSALAESADPPHLHFELRMGDQPADPGIN